MACCCVCHVSNLTRKYCPIWMFVSADLTNIEAFYHNDFDALYDTMSVHADDTLNVGMVRCKQKSVVCQRFEDILLDEC